MTLPSKRSHHAVKLAQFALRAIQSLTHSIPMMIKNKRIWTNSSERPWTSYSTTQLIRFCKRASSNSGWRPLPRRVMSVTWGLPFMISQLDCLSPTWLFKSLKKSLKPSPKPIMISSMSKWLCTILRRSRRLKNSELKLMPSTRHRSLTSTSSRVG